MRMEMVNFKALVSSFRPSCECLLIMDPHFFSSLSNTNLIFGKFVFTAFCQILLSERIVK